MIRTVVLFLCSAVASVTAGFPTTGLFDQTGLLFGVDLGGGGGSFGPRLVDPISGYCLDAGPAFVSVAAVQEFATTLWALVPLCIAIFTARHRASRSASVLLADNTAGDPSRPGAPQPLKAPKVESFLIWPK